MQRKEYAVEQNAYKTKPLDLIRRQARGAVGF